MKHPTLDQDTAPWEDPPQRLQHQQAAEAQTAGILARIPKRRRSSHKYHGDELGFVRFVLNLEVHTWEIQELDEDVAVTIIAPQSRCSTLL